MAAAPLATFAHGPRHMLPLLAALAALVAAIAPATPLPRPAAADAPAALAPGSGASDDELAQLQVQVALLRVAPSQAHFMSGGKEAHFVSGGTEASAEDGKASKAAKVAADAEATTEDAEAPRAAEAATADVSASRAAEVSSSTLPDVLVQYGEARTATTLQYQTLCAIMHLLHESEPERVVCQFTVSPADFLKRQSRYFHVVKTHLLEWLESKAAFTREFWLFATARNHSAGQEGEVCDWQSTARALSKTIGWHVKYAQVDQLLLRRGYQILADYKPIFNLSDHQLNSLSEYIRYWNVLRQCCGVQMSEDWRAVLQNRSTYKLHHSHDSPAYPACEIYDLNQVESALLRTSMFRRFYHKQSGLGHVSDQDAMIGPLTGTYCSTINRQIACQDLKFNQRPARPYC